MTGDSSIRAGSAGYGNQVCNHRATTRITTGIEGPALHKRSSAPAAHRRAPSGARLPLGRRLAALAAADPALAASVSAYIKKLRGEAAQNRVEVRTLRARLAELEEGMA